MSKISFDSEYDGYVFLGAAQGRFEAEDKGPSGTTSTVMKDYYQMFVVSPVSSFKSTDYQAFGFKAEKKKCISSEIWKELHIGDRVKLFFDDRERIVMAVLDG